MTTRTSFGSVVAESRALKINKFHQISRNTKEDKKISHDLSAYQKLIKRKGQMIFGVFLALASMVQAHPLLMGGYGNGGYDNYFFGSKDVEVRTRKKTKHLIHLIVSYDVGLQICLRNEAVIRFLSRNAIRCRTCCYKNGSRTTRAS